MSTNTMSHTSSTISSRGESADPVAAIVKPASVDLVAAIVSVLQTCNQSVAKTTRAATTLGVSPETLAASLVVTVVEEWLAQQPRTFPVAVTVADVNATESTRAATALTHGGGVRLSLHLPPMLMLRLAELAGETDQTPEKVAVDVLGGAIDSHHGRVCVAAGKPTPRPWRTKQ